jgi:hypothetical protein
MRPMKGGIRFSIASLFAVPLCLLSCGGGSGTTPPPAPACAQLTGYAASSTTALSFATDVLPILQSSSSCGLGSICHGDPPVGLDPARTRFLPFMGAPATVKAQLLGSSVNAPSMKLVVPKNVGSSFLAYKVSGTDALKCIESMCMAHATIGTNPPSMTQVTACGDPMPRIGGVLSAGDRTKILDWIAQGATD